MIIDNNPEEFDIKKRNRIIFSITIFSIVAIILGFLIYDAVLPNVSVDKIANNFDEVMVETMETIHSLQDESSDKSDDQAGKEKTDMVDDIVMLKEDVQPEKKLKETKSRIKTQGLLQEEKTQQEKKHGNKIKITQLDPQAITQTNKKKDDAIFSYTIQKGQTFWSIVSDLGFKDPWRWKDLLKQNEEKVHSVIFNVNKNKWQVNVKPDTVLSHDPKFRLERKRVKLKKYAFQIISLEEKYKEKAIEITRELINKGYYAYLYRTKRKIYSASLGKSVFFNRVRVGFFNTQAEAAKTARNLINHNIVDLDKDDYFIVIPSRSELQGIKNDLGIQNTSNYVLQLSNFKSKQSAVNLYSKTLNYATFGYISQVEAKGVKYYRNRIGFFETRKDALKVLRKIKKKFKKIRIIKVTNIFENALGQNLGTNTYNLIK